MIWQDFFVSRRLGSDAIAAGVGQVFGVKPEQVLVVPELGPMDLDEGVRILVGARKVSGDFTMYISIIPQWSPVQLGDEFEVVRKLCTLWDCESLVSSASLNPYSWLLVGREGPPHEVSLDPDQLDSNDRYVLARRERTEDAPT